eukprot:TRINITY_DN11726_c0_g1_i1.p1 TRINITY_DN11726_c0_g1~~TRINITY_DN11726_c0_g1_i1.p1  ORF type:complete len:304 (-),score=91.41 TRINITY_DN11726_c0_g1_i1:46-957(-)
MFVGFVSAAVIILCFASPFSESACFDITVAPFEIAGSNHTSDFTFQLFDVGTGLTTDVSPVAPPKPFQVCQDNGEVAIVKVILKELASHYDDPQTRTAYVLINGHRVFTFNQPTFLYNSITISIDQTTTTSSTPVVQFSNWVIDGYEERQLPAAFSLESCLSIDVQIMEQGDKNASVLVNDQFGNLVFYGAGTGHALQKQVSGLANFSSEVCTSGDYVVTVSALPFDACDPISIIWELNFGGDKAQNAYKSSFFEKEVTSITVDVQAESVVITGSQQYGSGIALPTPACPGFLHSIQPQLVAN